MRRNVTQNTSESNFALDRFYTQNKQHLVVTCAEAAAAAAAAVTLFPRLLLSVCQLFIKR